MTMSMTESITKEKQRPTRHTPILVTGAHRAGTTWVGKMLAAGGRATYISEPLNRWHRPGVMQLPVKHWSTYICPDNEGNYLPAFEDTLALRYHTWAELKSLRSRKDLLRMGRDWGIFTRGRLAKQRPLLKDPFAVFSVPWFIERLGCQVIVSVRHPAAFTSSLKRLQWDFDFQDLLEQPLLMRDWLEPFRDEMVNSDKEDVVAQGALLWRIIYQVVDTYRQQFPDVRMVRHEDLAHNPQEGFHDLYRFLDLKFTTAARRAVLQSSAAGNPKESSRSNIYAVRLDSRASLNNWKRRLSSDEIMRVQRLTGELARRLYPAETW